MLAKYKKSHIDINILLAIVLSFLIINVIIIENTSYLFLITTVLIPTIILIARYGYERKSRRFKYELAFYVFAYSALFLIATYIIGLFTGFTSNVYKLNFTNLIKNIIPYFILISTSEVLRYEISRKGDGSILSYILITMVLVFVDACLFLTTFDILTGDGQIKFICSIILPSIFKNITLLFYSKNGGILPCMIYRIMLDLKLVVVPIFPNFGIYFESLIYTILPMVMLFIISFQLKGQVVEEQKEIEKRKKELYKYMIFIVALTIVLFINILVSNVFKYSIVSIGSGSMSPNINKGDAVIFERLSVNQEPEIGDILVFKKENNVVVHRVIEIVTIQDKEKIYYTKGDANENPDGYPIERKNILGIVKKRVRYIGAPSVALGEMLNK